MKALATQLKIPGKYLFQLDRKFNSTQIGFMLNGLFLINEKEIVCMGNSINDLKNNWDLSIKF